MPVEVQFLHGTQLSRQKKTAANNLVDVRWKFFLCAVLPGAASPLSLSTPAAAVPVRTIPQACPHKL